MKRLKSIQVAGRRFKIIFQEMEDFGGCDTDAEIIYLHKDCLKNEELYFATLAHEAAHIMLRVSGLYWSLCKEDDTLEESLVRAIESLYVPVIRALVLELE